MEVESDCRPRERAYIAFTHAVTQDLLKLKAISTVLKDVGDVGGDQWQNRRKLCKLRCLFDKEYIQKKTR